jgi:hypothetical protein
VLRLHLALNKWLESVFQQIERFANTFVVCDCHGITLARKFQPAIRSALLSHVRVA